VLLCLEVFSEYACEDLHIGDVETSDPSVCMLLRMFVCMCMREVFPDSWMWLCHACLCYDILVEVEGICLFEGFCLSMHVFRGSVCV